MKGAEKWLAVPGWEERYEVSNFGRVRSIDRVIVRSDGKARRFRGRTLSLCNADGYRVVVLSRGEERKTARVHALVAEAFIGPRPESMEVCHCDGRRANNQVNNLRYDSRSANHFDKLLHGTMPMGESHPNTRLTYEAVIEIRALNGKLKQSSLAQMHGVTVGVIQDVQKGRSWKYVGGATDIDGRKGAKQGARNPRSKLTEQDILKIREKKGTASQDSIAKEFGVSQSVISSVIRGVAWSHIGAAAPSLESGYDR